AVYADRLRSGGFGTRAHALEAADVGDHLVVVAVAMPAPHRLDVPAVLLVVLIHKERLARLKRLPQKVLTAIADKPHRDPLVPAGDKDELRVYLQGAPPLLGEAEALFRRDLIGRRLLAVVEAAPDVGGRVLGGADGDLFRLVGRVMPARLLRIVVQPGPFVLAVAEPAVRVGPGPRLAEGEEV